MPPSLPHEVVIEMLRRDGELARALIGDAISLGALTPENVPSDFVQYPTERRADNVTLFRDARKRVRLAVVIEVQRKIDPGKKHSWPAYLVEARARFRCPIYLVVIAFRRKVVEWAGASIKLGHPGFVLTPIVISSHQVPFIASPLSARLNPRMAVVSALAHRDPSTAAAALKALDQLPQDLRRIYWEAIMSELSPTKRAALEKLMEDYVPRTKFGLELQAIGRKEGLAQGLEKGLEKGTIDMVLTFAEAKLGKLSRKMTAAIRRVAKDQRKARSLALRLGRAQTEAQARAILARVIR